MAQLSRLMGRLDDEVADEALIVRSFAGLPNPDPHGTHRVQVTFVVDEDRKPKESDEDEEEFKRIAEQEAREAQERRADEARDDLRKMLDGNDDGIGLENDDDG